MRDMLPLGLSRAAEMAVCVLSSGAGELPHDAPIWVSLARNTYGRALSTLSIATICEQHLGMSKVHTLRHTFASETEDTGAKMSEIRYCLGYSSLAMTDRYLSKLKRDRNPYATS